MAAAPSTTLLDDECIAFLAAILEPDDIIEFVTIPASSVRVWGSLESTLEILPRLRKANAKEHAYFGANPRTAEAETLARRRGQAKRAGKKAEPANIAEEVSLARCLFVDFDKSLSGEKLVVRDEALQRIADARLPDPTAVLSTGRGIHAYWRLDEPITDLELWRGHQKALIRLLSSDGSIHNPNRLMRLPGFVNVKYDDRPLCRVLDLDVRRVYPLFEFPAPVKGLTRSPSAGPVQPGSMSKLSRRFLNDGFVPQTIASRRTTMFTVACDLKARDWSLEDATDILMRRMRQIGLDEQDVTDCPRQIANAFSRAREPLPDEDEPDDVVVPQSHDETEAALAPNVVETLPNALDLIRAHPMKRAEIVHGLLREGETMNIVASPKTGKAIAIETPILTTRGWRMMIDLEPGDVIFAGDGSPTRIVAATPTLSGRPCYRVAFKSGASIVADAKHQWVVRSRDVERIVNTEDLHRGDADGRRWKVPVSGVMQTPVADLPVDPWLLGYWLGNGTQKSGQLTVNARDVEEVLARCTSLGYSIGKLMPKGGSVTFTVLTLGAQLRAIGVTGHKHIPDAYLMSGPDQRRQLLAGLLDSDGHASTRSNGAGSIEFCSIKRMLAEGVHFLFRSLGIKARTEVGDAKLNGRIVSPKFRIHCAGSRELGIFTLRRKVEALPERGLSQRSGVDAIVSVERIPTTPVRCIQVDHPSGTYLAGRDLTVTHNSLIVTDLSLAVCGGARWLDTFGCRRGRVLIIDNELHPETMADRLREVADARDVDDETLRRIQILSLRGRLQSIHQVTRTLDKLDRGAFDVIVLDAFYRFLPAEVDENSNAAIANVYNVIDQTADKLGAAVVCIHHTSKGVQSGKGITDVGAGAGSQSRAVDTHVVLRPHEQPDAIVFEAVTRSFKLPAPRVFRKAWPLFHRADDLDPADLLREFGRKKREDREGSAPKPGEVRPWDAERVLDEIVGQKEVTRAEVESDLMQRGLTRARSRELWDEARPSLVPAPGAADRGRGAKFCRAAENGDA